MKLKNILRNVTAMALPLALLGSCTGDFEELNTNPYEIDPEELPFEAQFSTPLSFSYPTHQNLFQYWTSLSIDNYGGYFEVPHSNWTMARYDLARGFCGGMHENFMQKIFNNTRRLIKQCDAAGQHDFAAVARIVEAYNLLQYTDTYGPVPYSSCPRSGRTGRTPQQLRLRQTGRYLQGDIRTAGQSARRTGYGDRRSRIVRLLVQRRPHALEEDRQPAQAAHGAAHRQGKPRRC